MVRSSNRALRRRSRLMPFGGPRSSKTTDHRPISSLEDDDEERKGWKTTNVKKNMLRFPPTRAPKETTPDNDDVRVLTHVLDVKTQFHSTYRPMKRHGGTKIGLNISSFLWSYSAGLFLIYSLNISTAVVMTEPEEVVIKFSSVVGPQNGTFSTPQHPEEYPQNIRRRFQFRAKTDEVVWIKWHDFDLEKAVPSTKQCRNDFVEVVVIDYYNVQHVYGRFCGNTKPPDFTTMQYAVDIIFHSSVTRHHQGFKGTYYFIPEKAVAPPESTYPGKSNPHAFGCGGLVQGQHGGVIRSPGFPDDYPAGVDCSWVIRVRPDRKIFIKVLEIELTPYLYTQCDDAQLVVLDGYALVLNSSQIMPLPTDTQYQRIVLCGDQKYHNDEGMKSLMSDRNRMIIRFRTTKAPSPQVKDRRKQFGSPVGFHLVWTEVSIEATCDKFYCRGGEYCIDEGKKVCATRKRYCIDNSLVCDGVPNCAEFDDSDEENCYSREIIVAGASLFTLLVVVIVMVVCCQRRHGRKQMRRALDETATQDTITTNDINFTVPDHHQFIDAQTNEVSKGPLRLALMNKLDKSPLPRNRGGEISVLPQNCYPARSTSVEEREDLAARQPFLAVPNHVPTPSPAGTSRSPSSPQFRYPDLETNEFVRKTSQDSFKRSSRKDSSKKPSITLMTTPPRVPAINVVGVPPNDIWEQRGGDSRISPRELTPESLTDSESPLWKEFQADSKGTAEVNVIRRRRSSIGFTPETDMPPPVYPSVVHEEDDEEGADEVEMVTFSPRPPPPPLKIASQAPFAMSMPASSRLQGILKPSTSLPPPSYRAVVSVDIPPSSNAAAPRRMMGGGVPSSTTTVAVHRVPAVPSTMPFTNVNPAIIADQHLHQRLINPADHRHLINQPRTMIRQKAVEFHETPHSSSLRRSNAPPPLNLPHSDVSSSASAIEPGSSGGNNNNDRSPSPWHQRVKPTAV